MTEEVSAKEHSGGNENPEPNPASDKPTTPSSPRSRAARLVPAGLPREEAVRRLEAIYRLTRLIADSSHDVQRLAEALARMLSEMLGDMALITLLNSDKETYHIAAYYDPDPRVVSLFEATLADVSGIPRTQGWVAGVIDTGQPLLVPAISVEQAAASAVPAFVEFVRQVGIASMVIVPIAGRSGVVGTIALSRHSGGRVYDENDQGFLAEIGFRAGVAIDNFTLIQSLRSEISGRLFAGEALAASEQRFLSIFRATPLGISIMDLVGNLIESNPAFQDMTGFSERELIGTHFHDMLHPEDVPPVLDLLTRIKTGREPHARLEHRTIRNDGSVVWVRTTFAGVPRGAGDPTLAMIFGITEDFSERKRADTELLELKQHLQGSIELERLRLAQDLHDTPLQELYAVIYKLEELRAKADPAASAQLGEVVDDIQHTLNSLRTTASELRPPALSRFGLEKALRSYIEDFREKHPELHVKMSLAHDRQFLPEAVRLVLFRVFQAALGNVVRHAHATEVSVRFSFDAEEARIEIGDNGGGFEVPSSWIAMVRAGHYGLAGMAERVSAAGGTLVVESAPGNTTLIRATVPCAQV